MKILMVRHGATKGNQEKRYVGCTDESLLDESVGFLCELRARNMCLFEKVDVVYTSPMLRCKQSASILFPEITPIEIDDFCECDFGDFEYQNYEELNGNPDYQAYIDSGGMCGFPNGETKETFQKRCVRAFDDLMRSIDFSKEMIAITSHGGTIMAILDEYSYPHRDYFDWQLGTGEGYLMDVSMCDGVIALENIRMI